MLMRTAMVKSNGQLILTGAKGQPPWTHSGRRFCFLPVDIFNVKQNKTPIWTWTCRCSLTAQDNVAVWQHSSQQSDETKWAILAGSHAADQVIWPATCSSLSFMSRWLRQKWRTGSNRHFWILSQAPWTSALLRGQESTSGKTTQAPPCHIMKCI